MCHHFTRSYVATRSIHIDDITTKASQRLYFIILLKRAGIEPHHLVKIYTTIIRSVIEYACQVRHTSLTIRQTNLFRKGPCALYVVECVIATPSLPREYQRWQTNHKLHNLLLPSRTCNYFLHNVRAYGVPRCKTNRIKNSFVPYGVYNRQWMDPIYRRALLALNCESF